LQSGCGRNFLVALGSSRFASAATGLRSLFLVDLAGRPDRRGQDTQGDAFFGFAFLLGFLATRSAIGAELRPFATLEAITAAFTIPAGTLAGLSLAFILGGLRIGGQFFLALDFLILVVAAAALGLLFLETRTTLFQHAEIMIRILKIIFGLDPVAGKLRVARQRLVLFKQLGGIAALAVILPVSGTAGHALWALSTAATTTAALTIVDQLVVSLSHWRRHSRSPQFFLP
jgi:hypothetical protein